MFVDVAMGGSPFDRDHFPYEALNVVFYHLLAHKQTQEIKCFAHKLQSCRQ